MMILGMFCYDTITLYMFEREGGNDGKKQQDASTCLGIVEGRFGSRGVLLFWGFCIFFFGEYLWALYVEDAFSHIFLDRRSFHGQR